MTNNSTPTRFQAIDIVRGLVMIIMALDHTRDLFHITASTQDPTDLAIFYSVDHPFMCTKFCFSIGIFCVVNPTKKIGIRSS
jgi:uncharacterized membrane protein